MTTPTPPIKRYQTSVELNVSFHFAVLRGVISPELLKDVREYSEGLRNINTPEELLRALAEYLSLDHTLPGLRYVEHLYVHVIGNMQRTAELHAMHLAGIGEGDVVIGYDSVSWAESTPVTAVEGAA